MAKPFTILVDTAEQHPWNFSRFTCRVQRKYLGKHIDKVYYPRGDYSVQGMEGMVHVERKSCADAQSTILGFKSGRRKRFENELAELSEMDASCVIVECSLGWLLANPPQRGTKTAEEETRNLHSSLISFSQRFPVPWFFCDTRLLAEETCFRFLERFVNKQTNDVPF